jgi:hypothetical protein
MYSALFYLIAVEIVILLLLLLQFYPEQIHKYNGVMLLLISACAFQYTPNRAYSGGGGDDGYGGGYGGGDDGYGGGYGGGAGCGSISKKQIKFGDAQYKVLCLPTTTFPKLYNGLRETRRQEDIQPYQYKKDDKFKSVSLFLTPDIYMAKKYSVRYVRVYKLLKDVKLLIIDNNRQLDAEELEALRKKHPDISGVFINWNKQEHDATNNYSELVNKKNTEYIDIDVNFPLSGIEKCLKLVGVHEIVDDELSDVNLASALT